MATTVRNLDVDSTQSHHPTFCKATLYFLILSQPSYRSRNFLGIYEVYAECIAEQCPNSGVDTLSIAYYLIYAWHTINYAELRQER